MWPAVKAMLHSVYDQPDAKSVAAQFDRLITEYTERLPPVAEHLGGASHRRPGFNRVPGRMGPIWSNNPLNGSNREIQPAPTPSGSSPTAEAIIRLVGAVPLNKPMNGPGAPSAWTSWPAPAPPPGSRHHPQTEVPTEPVPLGRITA